MNIFALGQIAAWVASALLGIWLLLDLTRTNRKYSEETLMSSREGEIEDELSIEPAQGASL